MRDFIPILGDVIWPTVYLEQRLLSLWSILPGFLIEYIFVICITTLGKKKAFLATFLMNLISTLLGIILIPISGLMVGKAFYQYLQNSGLGWWSISFCVAVLMNAGIETLVIWKGFGEGSGKRIFGWLCLANGISVGLALGSLWLFPAKY